MRQEDEHEPIFLKAGTKIDEISNVRKRLKTLTDDPETFIRFYCPEEHRTSLAKILNRK